MGYWILKIGERKGTIITVPFYSVSCVPPFMPSRTFCNLISERQIARRKPYCTIEQHWYDSLQHEQCCGHKFNVNETTLVESATLSLVPGTRMTWWVLSSWQFFRYCDYQLWHSSSFVILNLRRKGTASPLNDVAWLYRSDHQHPAVTQHNRAKTKLMAPRQIIIISNEERGCNVQYATTINDRNTEARHNNAAVPTHWWSSSFLSVLECQLRRAPSLLNRRLSSRIDPTRHSSTQTAKRERFIMSVGNTIRGIGRSEPDDGWWCSRWDH